MNGTGTQIDPYVVENAADLYEMKNIGSEEAYFKLGADIDFNETEYAGSYEPITFFAKEFDGCGHTIRNIYSSSSDTARLFYDKCAGSTVFKNLNIENAVLIGALVQLFAPDAQREKTAEFENCRFHITANEGTLSSSSSEGFFNKLKYSVKMKYCTVLIDLRTGRHRSILRSSALTGCQFRLNITYDLIAISSTSHSFFYDVKCVDTAFIGKIKARTETPRTANFSMSGSFNNCYQAIEYENITSVNWDSTIAAPCFYDKELTGGITVGNSNSSSENNQRIFALTTEQCKDAAYLRSIGYVCAGE